MLFWGLLGAVIAELALLLLLILLPSRDEPGKPERDQSKPGQEDLLTALDAYSARKPELEKEPHPERRERSEPVLMPVPTPTPTLTPTPAPLGVLRQPEPQQEPDPEPPTRVTALPAPVQREPEPELPPEHRPAKPEAPRERPQTGITEKCEIKLWRGYVKCQLYAALRDRPGEATGFAFSPVFRLPDEDTPTEEATGALKTLIDHLEEDGWTVMSEGKHWYQLRLARSPEET